METIYRGGRPVGGFALAGEGTPPPAPAGGGTVALASMMTGATAGLLAHVLRAPMWGSILAGAAAAVTTRYAIDRA